MTVKSVRAAILKAVSSLEGCDGPNITVAEAKKITKAATADGINAKSERKVISDFYDTKRTKPAPGTVQTLACPESTRPAFDAGAERVMNMYLSLPTGGITGGAGGNGQ